jgi:hypothetical protein
MRIATAEPWVAAPLQQFVDDTRARLALLLHPSGQVLAQCGFARAVDVMSACALAAAIHASGSELGRQLDGRPFRELHHAGADRQLYLAQADWAHGSYILLTVFDAESSIGLVRLFFETFERQLAAAAPALATVRAPVFGTEFERELRESLDSLFRAAPQPGRTMGHHTGDAS